MVHALNDETTASVSQPRKPLLGAPRSQAWLAWLALAWFGLKKNVCAFQASAGTESNANLLSLRRGELDS